MDIISLFSILVIISCFCFYLFYKYRDKRISKKHKAPILCKLIVRIIGKSPSIMFFRCSIGCKYKNKKCKNCMENIRETICEGFMKGLEDGIGMSEEVHKLVEPLDEIGSLTGEKKKTNNWLKMHGQVKHSKMSWKKRRKLSGVKWG